MHTDAPFPETLPARLLDQPSSGQLDLSFTRGEGNQFGISYSYVCRKFRRYHRVFEETAGIPQHVRVRQFAPSDVDHRIAHVLDGGLLDPPFFQFILDAAIVRVEFRVLG